MSETLKVIGLCGRSGSGKGFVCELFSEYGIPSIDTDKVYRDILADRSKGCLDELCREFGPSVIAEDGSLDRKALSRIVFSGSDDKLSILNEITHKYILEETEKKIEKARADKKRAVIVDAPVLFESGFDRLCDITVCVTATDDISVERITRRDCISRDDALRRLSHQKTNDELRALCDLEIVNDASLDVTAEVEKIVKDIIVGGNDEK